MSIPNLTPVDPWPSRKLPQERFDASVKTAMDQMSVMVGELNDSFIPAVNQAVDTMNTITPNIPAILDAPNHAAAAAASAKAAATSAGAAAESVSAAAQEVEKAKGEVVNAQAEAERAKVEADRAEEIASVGPAMVGKLGLVKPDGKTTQTTEDGALSVPTFEGSAAGLVPAATPSDAKKVLLGNGTWGSVEEDAAAMTISEDLILTADSPRTLVLTASVPNLSVHLPAPSTLADGTTFHIIVRSLEDIQLCDFSGQSIKAYPILSISTAIRVQLVDSLTGLWALSKYESGSTSDAQGEPGLNIGELTIFNSDTLHGFSIAALSADRAIVCWQDANNSNYGTACTLSISGTTVSAGNAVVFNANTINFFSVAALSETKAIVCYTSNNSGKSRVLSISGTTVSAGGEVTFSSVSVGDISVNTLTESTALVSYSAESQGRACVLSIAGTVVSAGTIVTFSKGSIDYLSAAALSENKALVCYRKKSDYGTVCTLSISGTTVSAGSEVTIPHTKMTENSLAVLSEIKAVILYSNINSSSRPYGAARVVSVSDMTVSVGDEFIINNNQISNIKSVSISETGVVAIYSDLTTSKRAVKSSILNILGESIASMHERFFSQCSVRSSLSMTKMHSPLPRFLIVFGSGYDEYHITGITGVIYIS